MTFNPMTHRQGQALAKFLAALRPDWDTPGIEHQLGKARHAAPVDALAIAAIKAAATVTNRSPAVIGLDGPHWRGSDVAPRIAPPAADERCSTCSMRRDRCRETWATDHEFVSAAVTAAAKRGPEVHDIAAALKAEVQPMRGTDPKPKPERADNPHIDALREQLKPSADDTTA